jgi:parvulin-like peptidyl-prolyl isomerase
MPNVDLDLDRVWERQPDEDTDAYRAFIVFRDMTPSSTVEQACRKAQGGDPPADVVAAWQSWAADWAWEERARRYRDSAEAAAATARDLTQRWASAKEFYKQDPDQKRGFLASLFRRGRSAGRAPAPGREGWLKKWARERERRKHFAAQEAAAIRSAKGGKKRSLAERWTLFVRKRRASAEEQRYKGWRGRLLRLKRQTRVVVRKHTIRFVLIFGGACLLVGAFAGMLFLRWRRMVFQNAVVFTVNEARIHRNLFQARLEEAGARTVMQEIIEKNLRTQFARAKKAYPSNKEVDARIAEDKKDPSFAKSIAAAGMTTEQYRDAVRDELAQARLMSAGVSVTDAEVRKFYEANVDKKNPRARFYVPEAIQVAVIGTRSREACLAALDDLKEGVPWEEAARSHSLDVSAFSGGLLPPFAKGRTMSAMIPGMDATLFAMNQGERIGPVRFGEGWWLIQCRDKVPEKTMPFEYVALRARTWALMEKGVPKNGRRIASEYAAFQKRAKVQVFDPFFRSLMAR